MRKGETTGERHQTHGSERQTKKHIRLAFGRKKKKSEDFKKNRLKFIAFIRVRLVLLFFSLFERDTMNMFSELVVFKFIFVSLLTMSS
ncbi:hypothetical protein HanRHA438_Chr15g0727681 [Helianthus annuus]|nr:hypothetical protein HanRHA438_Chr15g0727681 [Helianthus annuus]